MQKLLAINVNEHTEKKNGLTYLSWAWAWAKVLELDPAATWVVHTYGTQGAEQPYMSIGKTAMVHTSVTINGVRRECMLPVMDHRNKAIHDPDAFAVNTAIMRCMTKAISMHGLGLYIYAGEDLPQAEGEAANTEVTAPVKSMSAVISARKLAYEALTPEERHQIDGLAEVVIDVVKNEGVSAALDQIDWNLKDDQDLRAGLAYKLDSATNAALKKESQQRQAAKKEAA